MTDIPSMLNNSFTCLILIFIVLTGLYMAIASKNKLETKIVLISEDTKCSLYPCLFTTLVDKYVGRSTYSCM